MFLWFSHWGSIFNYYCNHNKSAIISNRIPFEGCDTNTGKDANTGNKVTTKKVQRT